MAFSSQLKVNLFYKKLKASIKYVYVFTMYRICNEIINLAHANFKTKEKIITSTSLQ